MILEAFKELAGFGFYTFVIPVVLQFFFSALIGE